MPEHRKLRVRWGGYHNRVSLRRLGWLTCGQPAISIQVQKPTESVVTSVPLRIFWTFSRHRHITVAPATTPPTEDTYANQDVCDFRDYGADCRTRMELGGCGGRPAFGNLEDESGEVQIQPRANSEEREPNHRIG